MKKMKDKRLSIIFYTVGTGALIVMLGFSVFNFSRDARLLELPVLSKVASTPSKASDSTDTKSDYKTLKYKKTDTKSSNNSSDSKPTKKPTVKATKKLEATPTPRVDP